MLKHYIAITIALSLQISSVFDRHLLVIASRTSLDVHQIETLSIAFSQPLRSLVLLRVPPYCVFVQVLPDARLLSFVTLLSTFFFLFVCFLQMLLQPEAKVVHSTTSSYKNNDFIFAAVCNRIGAMKSILTRCKLHKK